uniref:Uncharacterized protein n=1 Tax=Caenorhabditis tropicalis TaxID=1561998 RepID=A0A1I7TMA8_9PELO
MPTVFSDSLRNFEPYILEQLFFFPLTLTRQNIEILFIDSSIADVLLIFVHQFVTESDYIFINPSFFYRSRNQPIFFKKLFAQPSFLGAD